jgi:phosphonate transport system substrate-binding protein
MALVPGQDSSVLLEHGKVLENWLKEKTGLVVEISVPVNFIAVVEGMGSQRIDVAIMNPFGYLLAQQKFGARALLMGVNHGVSQHWGQIITAHPDVRKLEDLQGKSFAYVDPASTSGHILAAALLKQKGIKVGKTTFTGKHDSVVTMVYQGRVAAGATFFTPPLKGVDQDARRLVATQYPDVYQKVRILAKTGPIPSEPVVFRKDLPSSVESKIVSAMKEFGTTENGAATLTKLYHLTGFKDCSDKDYDSIRSLLSELGINPLDPANIVK